MATDHMHLKTTAKSYDFIPEDTNSLGGIKPIQAKGRKNFCFVLGCFAGIVVLFGFGFLAGYLVKGPGRQSLDGQGTEPSNVPKDFERFHKMFKDSISVTNLENLMREFSSRPHIAGSDRQHDLADKRLATYWKAFGFDKVEIPEYKVLLSFPQPEKPNRVSIVENNTVIYETIGKVKISPGPNGSETFDHYPYLAYAHNGTVEGDVIYANYGQEKDFQKLSKMNITVRGKIVLMRSRNVVNAEKHGAVGALVYADPSFSAQQGYEARQVYPNGQWLSSGGIQEGSILFASYVGDPLTPVLPSIKGMYRRPVNESMLPRIPAQAISYKAALELLQRLKGLEAPKNWQGGLNITYHTGPGFKNSSVKVKLEINNKLQEKTIYNVIGTIFGQEEPDRYVIIGNHRDSWSFGAVDALSGTTVTNEIARVLGTLLKKGWRPRRTIKVCSWGGEEFNLIGSHEWVEENANILTERAVAYINLDIAVCGNYVLRARASPLFKQITHKWARQVKDPNNVGGSDTVYDIWLRRTPSDTNKKEPMIMNLFSASDYVSFYQYLGIPCGDFGYWFGYDNRSSLYPVYHSQQDTFYWVKQFVDQRFEVHKAMTQFGGGMTLDIADQPLLPFDIWNYALALNNSFHVLSSSPKFVANGISLTDLHDAISKFLKASKMFESLKSDQEILKNPFKLRMINDQIVKVEMAFIYPYGLPGSSQSRHVAFNFGFHNLQPLKATFPGVTEALHLAEESGDWDLVRKQLSIAVYCVKSATRVLEPLNV